MGMDIDYIAAKDAIDKLESLLINQPHGEREEIADEILNFVQQIEKKYEKTSEK